MYTGWLGFDGVYQKKGGESLNNKKVSVCIPFYNIEPYVRRCLDSVLGNTYQNLEVICVNDGSTDGTSAVLHEYAEKDSRVIVVDKENGGIVSARQAAMDIAAGDFISFIDGDDWVHPQFFEILVSVREKTDADAVVCGYVKTDHEESNPEIDLDQVIYTIDGLDCVSRKRDVRALIWGRLYTSELIPTLQVDRDIAIGEDAILNLLFLCNKPKVKIAVVSEKLYYYFQRPGSLVHTLSHLNRVKVCDYFARHINEIENCSGQKIIIDEILRSMFSYRYLAMFLPEQKSVQRHCRELYVLCKNRWDSLLSYREKCKYTLIYHCPAFYRLFRIITDPTMLDWERAEKKRQREKAGK